MLVALLPRNNSLENLNKENWYHITVNSSVEMRIPPRVLELSGVILWKRSQHDQLFLREVEEVEKVKRKEHFPND